MDETPYIQTISDEQLEKMIARRRAAALRQRNTGDKFSYEACVYHLKRALAERRRRLEEGQGG